MTDLNQYQARAIIKTITGVTVDEHPEALDIAWELGHTLIAAVHTLDIDGTFSDK